MGKKDSSRLSTRETHTSSEATTGESSHRPRNKLGRLMGKVQDGMKKLRPSRSKDSRSPSLVPPNVYHKRASSAPNIQVQADTQSALQDAQEAAKDMHPLSGPVITVVSAGQSAQESLDTADKFQNTYLQPLRIFDAVIEKIADVHPYAKMALGMLSCASKIILAQVDRDDAVLKLLEKLGQVYSFVTQDEMLGQISSMRIILGQISQQTRECAHFIKNYSETKNFWKRLGKNVISETNDTIQQYSDVLDKLMQNFRDQVTRDIAIHIYRTGETLDLSGMTYAGATGLDTRKQCLEGTRTEILSEITEWVNSTGDNVPRVLWLSGPAGKGKSAIAHTIAKSFSDVGGLGSCFSFDREREADRRHEKIFSTIARDLADRDPDMRRALADAVQKSSSLKTTADIIQQWQKLLIEPLGKSSGSTVGPVVIMIDALDESGGVKTRKDLLRILAGKHRDSDVSKITDLPDNFRFIITSRPLSDINEEFHGVQHIRQISMDDIPAAVARRDIKAYISKELEGSDFQDGQFAVLAEKADGLFEWARLACEYIKESHTGLSPNDCYEAVVSRDPAERSMLLHDMYRLILTDVMPRGVQHSQKQHSTALARFRSVMGQILGTAEPLPLASLNAMRRHFPTREDQFEVDLVVKCMGSLLSGTNNPNSPIRPLHASFHDFLTDEQHSGEFFIEVSKAQRDLAFASLGVMKHGLRFNICDLTSSYLPNCDDPGLQERIATCIPPHLSYSSRFWISHVRTTVFGNELAKEVKSFFDNEWLFFWLELLALINALSGAVPALPLIPQWLKDRSEFKDISLTAIDVQRFIQVFGGMILHSTPHLYVSALPFSPVNSPLSRKLSAGFPNTLRAVSGRDLDWPAAQTVLRGHIYSVQSVSFSPDGTRIVTGSWDKTVRLWDAATGQPVGEPLRGHTDHVHSVSFSPDGTRIVSGSKDKTVRLWDAATGQPVGEPLPGHTDSVESVSFSPDGTRIATGSRDDTVRLWDAATGQPVGEPLRGHTDWVRSVSFSPDGTRIATGSADDTVRMWDAATGQSVGQPLRGHTHWVLSISFSPDGTRIVSGSVDKTVRLWDAATGQPVGQPLRGHTHEVSSVSFSPDGTRIVTGSRDGTVRLWDAATGQPVGEPLRGHTRSVESASFSPDGTRIVSGSMDKTIRLWDAATGQPVGEPLRGHTHSVFSVLFSPDGTRIVTGSQDQTVRLWHAAKGRPLKQCAESDHSAFPHNHFISFSPKSIHVLCDTSEFMEGESHDDRSLTSLSLNDDSGWVVGPKDRLLFWVPPASRHAFYNPRTALVIPRGGPELDLSRMAHGRRWQKCREEP